jgi:hypothetical protein
VASFVRCLVGYINDLGKVQPEFANLAAAAGVRGGSSGWFPVRGVRTGEEVVNDHDPVGHRGADELGRDRYVHRRRPPDLRW